ncbi:branched-chain amino acid ABC transporter permease [Microvirga antarctica]|uniref:branched-chain amino acid ABC transporter permease n=1 Tax=Microvirga antarctica TaxID=2819233 RepID=UPI001B307521|nr:branched-chain amino acid ABC transporter permease [Microvirga antarctica]
MQLFLQALASGLVVGAMYALIAVGFSLVLGTLKVIDFAYGSYVVLAGFITYWASTKLFTGGTVLDAALCILLAMVAVAAFGAFVWGVLLRKLLERDHLPQLVGTIGIAVVIGGALLTKFGTDIVLAQIPAAQTTLQIGPTYLSTGRVVGGLIGIATLILFMFMLNTRFGQMIRATATDPKGAALVGIHILRIRILTVSLAAALGALAGGLLVLFLPLAPADSNKYILIAFFTIAVGGLGSLRGAMIAAFLVALVEVFSQTYMPNIIKNAVPYLFVGAFIALVPQGLGNIRLNFGMKKER